MSAEPAAPSRNPRRSRFDPHPLVHWFPKPPVSRLLLRSQFPEKQHLPFAIRDMLPAAHPSRCRPSPATGQAKTANQTNKMTREITALSYIAGPGKIDIRIEILIAACFFAATPALRNKLPQSNLGLLQAFKCC